MIIWKCTITFTSEEWENKNKSDDGIMQIDAPYIRECERREKKTRISILVSARMQTIRLINERSSISFCFLCYMFQNEKNNLNNKYHFMIK